MTTIPLSEGEGPQQPEFCVYCGFEAWSAGNHDEMCVGYVHGFSWTTAKPSGPHPTKQGE